MVDTDRDRLPSHVIGDLGKKAAGDSFAAIQRVTALASSADDKMQITLFPVAGIFGLLAGFAQATIQEETSIEDVIDGLWLLIRPMALYSLGGDKAGFEAMLAKAPKEDVP